VQATKCELVINIKTAKAVAIKISGKSAYAQRRRDRVGVGIASGYDAVDGSSTGT
jgi:hypothetical protein